MRCCDVAHQELTESMLLSQNADELSSQLQDMTRVLSQSAIAAFMSSYCAAYKMCDLCACSRLPAQISCSSSFRALWPKKLPRLLHPRGMRQLCDAEEVARLWKGCA
jgi:hypothetical protein